MNENILLPELDYKIIKYLDPFNDYEHLCQTNKYYNELIKNNELYKGLKFLRRYYKMNYQDIANINTFFIEACSHGYIKLAKYLYNSNDINIHRNNEIAFRNSCSYGRKNVAEWLYNISKIDNNKINIHIWNEYAFRYSCTNGHFDTAQWLYNLSRNDNNTKINIHIENDDAFISASSNGHLKIVEWLYSISKIDNNTKINTYTINNAFRSVCENGHSDTAKWLYNLSTNKLEKNNKIDIHMEDDYIFVQASCEGHKSILNLLYNLSQIDGNKRYSRASIRKSANCGFDKGIIKLALKEWQNLERQQNLRELEELQESDSNSLNNYKYYNKFIKNNKTYKHY